MNSELTITIRVTHTQNLPRADIIAYIAGAALTEVMAADPKLLASGTVVSGAIAHSTDAPSLELPPRFAGLQRGG